MNVNFIQDEIISDPNWLTGCSFNINNNLLVINEDGSNDNGNGYCRPSSLTEISSTDNVDGFYQCYLPEIPQVLVTRDVFESGLKYTFNFQVGDVDANDIFDNGPIFDFTYTEPDHKSIAELALNGGSIYRYFTRTGSEGRKARLFVKYTSVLSYQDNLSTATCN